MLHSHFSTAYKTVNDLPLMAQIYLPDVQNPPVVLYIHGGALMKGSSADKYEKYKPYVEAGFSVASVDYRLAPETKLPSILDDIRDALLWVKGDGAKKFGWDCNKIAVVGGSAGGYLAQMSGTFDVKPNVIASFFGYGSLLWYREHSDIYSAQEHISKEQAESAILAHETTLAGAERNPLYLYTRQNCCWLDYALKPGLPDEKVKEYQPIDRITSDYPPIILFHGDADTDVPYSESVNMARALAQKGVINVFVTYPGGPHGFIKFVDNPQVAAYIKLCISFLKEYLQ